MKLLFAFLSVLVIGAELLSSVSAMDYTTTTTRDNGGRRGR